MLVQVQYQAVQYYRIRSWCLCRYSAKLYSTMESEAGVNIIIIIIIIIIIKRNLYSAFYHKSSKALNNARLK